MYRRNKVKEDTIEPYDLAAENGKQSAIFQPYKWPNISNE